LRGRRRGSRRTPKCQNSQCCLPCRFHLLLH
jgi:hypothetical protein